jgi:hypothetical protein
MDRGNGVINGEIIQQTLDRGGQVVGTAQRMSSFPYTYGQVPGPSHLKIDEQGACVHYGCTKRVLTKLETRVKYYAVAYQNGHGRLALLQATLDDFGPSYMDLITDPSKNKWVNDDDDKRENKSFDIEENESGDSDDSDNSDDSDDSDDSDNSDNSANSYLTAIRW